MKRSILKKFFIFVFFSFAPSRLCKINAAECPCSAKKNQVAWNTRTVPLNNFGTITDKKTHKISLPANNKFLCLFIPSTGPLKAKQIKILLVGFELKDPIPETIAHRAQEELVQLREIHPEVKSVIAAYRQVDNDSLWTKGPSIITRVPLHELQELVLELEPDATMRIYPVQGDHQITSIEQPKEL